MSKKLDRLWAPWRMEYVQNVAHKNESDEAKDCPFCLASASEASKDNLILFKGEKVFVIMNKFPYNPFHLMVLPNEHIGDISDLDPETWADLSEHTRVCIDILKECVNPQGINLGLNMGEAAGAGIAPHLHMHILPRWNGDTNFMPLLAETKSLPAHNLTVYQRLSKSFEGFSGRLKKFRMENT